MSSCPEDLEVKKKEITERRRVNVHEEIRHLLRRFSLAILINDESHMAIVDAACNIDRRKIFLEEAKRLIQEMEIQDARNLQADWGIQSPFERDEESSGV